MSATCLHENFKVLANVGRLTEKEGGPVTHYTVDISVECAGCGERLEFVGLPVGASPYQAMVSVDHTELRAPLRLKGTEVPEGLPYFRINLPPRRRTRLDD